jgi:chromosome segregation protein
MQGFKSFPDKTKLVFDTDDGKNKVQVGMGSTGVTVIVGPNGSGKSNISDAMRWVLGEISSKSLRGSKMEDVIFGGADSRKPMSYAEVSVTFDNRDEKNKLDCPYDEVTVTRRYYRAGESEYFINRRAVRLKDIYELFMNTGIGRDGYSIIGQGRIAEMVSRKSEERRSIFEDASGIAKFRHKKTDAERKLAHTEENMVRLRDIFGEIESRVGPLEKEAAKAKRAIELLDNKKRADVSLWLYDTEKLRHELDRAEEELRRSEFELQTAQDSVASMEEQNNRLFEQSQSNKMQSEQLLSEIRAQTDENHALDSEYRVKQTTLEHTKELLAATGGTAKSVQMSMDREMEDAQRHRARIAVLSEENSQLLDEKSELEKEQAENEKIIARLEENIATAGADLREREAQATDLRVRLSVVENAQQTDDGKNDSMKVELDNYVTIGQSIDRQRQQKAAVIAQYDESLASLQEQNENLQGLHEQQTATREEIIASRNAAMLRRDTVEQRIHTYRVMEEQFEGYSGSVRFVMKRYGEGRITDKNGRPCDTIYGPLSKLISVREKYIVAIETALGANLQNIVVENEATASAAIYALKHGEAGRATFLPLTSMRAGSPMQEAARAKNSPGFVGLANELVETDAKFTGILASLLGKTLVFDHLDHATAYAKSAGYHARIVTLDGQQINANGSFTGGSVRQGGGILTRAGEIQKLQRELEDIKKSLASLEERLTEVDGELSELDDQLSSLDEQMNLIAVLRNSEATAMEQLNAKYDANDTLTQKLRGEYEQITLMHARYEEELENLRAEEVALQNQITEIAAAREELHDQQVNLEDRQEEITSLLTDYLVRQSALQKDMETAQMLAQTAEERIASFGEQLQALQIKSDDYEQQIRTLTNQSAENREKYAVGVTRLDGLTARRKLIEDDGFAFEKKLNELGRRMREKMDEKEQISRVHVRNENRLSQLRADQDKLSGKLWEEYELTRADALALGYPPVTAENRMSVLGLQTECRNKLRSIGNVDLDAVEKYAELKERYDTMKVQIDDLEKSRKELNDIITTLEADMKTSFVESFNQINENFGRVFSELFGGGSAELSLTDPDNVLESGIEIKAAPPGKIIKSLMQLSGGEQSFIGVALFFAILQVNPTPFCILDEIEAALDEVNVERLAQYIKRYSDGTQFIMITHRRGTMAAATRLYGVTMPEHGISKVLALDVESITKEKGDDWNGIFG